MMGDWATGHMEMAQVFGGREPMGSWSAQGTATENFSSKTRRESVSVTG